jgi:hypothetical protein
MLFDESVEAQDAFGNQTPARIHKDLTPHPKGSAVTGKQIFRSFTDQAHGVENVKKKIAGNSPFQ